MSKTMKARRTRPQPRGNKVVHVKEARQIAKQEARKVIRQDEETKYCDTSLLAQAVDYTDGKVHSFTSGLLRGTTESNYLGDKIIPVGLHCKIQLTRSDSTQLFRIIIIQNKAGGVPLLGTLLQNISSLTTPLSLYDVDYEDTYRVLYDRLISMDSIRNTTMAFTIKIGQKRLRRIAFNDGSGTLEKGGIYLCIISDSAVTTHPTIDLRSRLYFKDP